MTPELQQRIEDCYIQYCEVIKPLIAQIEAQSEKFPLPIFNEIRAFNDHVARCYFANPSESYIQEQVARAERHIIRITLDCFKTLNVIAYRQIELFEKQTKNVDLTVIDNGMFFPEYSMMKVKAAEVVRQAKEFEAYDSYEALSKYQESYNLYSGIVERIHGVSEKVKWARVRFVSRRLITIGGWVVSIIVSALVSAYFSCEIIARLMD